MNYPHAHVAKARIFRKLGLYAVHSYRFEVLFAITEIFSIYCAVLPVSGEGCALFGGLYGKISVGKIIRPRLVVILHEVDYVLAAEIRTERQA